MKPTVGKVDSVVPAVNIAGLNAVMLANELINSITMAELYGYNSTISRRIMEGLCSMGKHLEEFAAIIPKPDKDEMVKEVISWFKNSPVRAQLEFTATQFNDLVAFHSTLGQNIRNHFNLWSYYKEGDDWHPDDVSMEVIEEVWRTVKDEE